LNPRVFSLSTGEVGVVDVRIDLRPRPVWRQLAATDQSPAFLFSPSCTPDQVGEVILRLWRLPSHLDRHRIEEIYYFVDLLPRRLPTFEVVCDVPEELRLESPILKETSPWQEQDV
jgi:hypothetical protein